MNHTHHLSSLLNSNLSSINNKVGCVDTSITFDQYLNCLLTGMTTEDYKFLHVQLFNTTDYFPVFTFKHISNDVWTAFTTNENAKYNTYSVRIFYIKN